MYRPLIAALVGAALVANAASAAAVPPVGSLSPLALARASGGVTVSRGSDENPVKEIAKSIYWGAVGGALIGGAILLADKSDNSDPLRWGIVIGTFGGLAVGTYFVLTRPQPAGLLEIGNGRVTPAFAGGAPPAEALRTIAAEPGGARVRLIGVRF